MSVGIGGMGGDIGHNDTFRLTASLVVKSLCWRARGPRFKYRSRQMELVKS